MTYRGGLTKATLLERCRVLRATNTNAEALLWQLLRDRQVAGAKFRRQHQFSSYILDFYCHESRLVMEVDGGQHFSRVHNEQDLARTGFLEAQGLRVL